MLSRGVIFSRLSLSSARQAGLPLIKALGLVVKVRLNQPSERFYFSSASLRRGKTFSHQ
jgi:hypothetical protein